MFKRPTDYKLLLIAAGIWAYLSAPSLDGWLFPVVARTGITTVVSDGDRTVFTGVSVKLRKCNFVSIDWRLKTEDGEVSVPVEFMENAKVRPPGDFSFGPWRVPLSADEFRNRSYAVVYHRCYPFWLTATKFYP